VSVACFCHWAARREWMAVVSPAAPAAASHTQLDLKKAGHHAWSRKAAKVSCFCSEPWQNLNDSRGSGAARFDPAFHRRHDYSRGGKECALH
jgi:hypothetical protein